MRNLKPIVAVICVAALPMILAPQSSSKQQLTTQPNDAAQRRVASAERVVQFFEQREAGGEALTASFFELKSNWQRRLFQARLDAATTKDQKLRVARERVAQTRRALDRPPLMDGPPHFMRESMEYDHADAECRVAELGA
jgi:hypothetical protein